MEEDNLVEEYNRYLKNLEVSELYIEREDQVAKSRSLEDHSFLKIFLATSEIASRCIASNLPLQ